MQFPALPIYYYLVICFIAGFLVYLEHRFKSEGLHEFFSKDTTLMQQIPVKGEKVVIVQVKVIFNDGKVESANLLPKTTVPETVSPK